MQVHPRLLVAAAITVTLLTACGERSEDQAATTAPAASETAESAEAPGKTTNFEEPSPSEEQKQPPG